MVRNCLIIMALFSAVCTYTMQKNENELESGDDDDHTSLVEAVTRLDYAEVRYMINHRIDRKDKPCNDNKSINNHFYFGSLLHLTELFADVQTAEILLMAGVSRDIVNEWDKTPLVVAREWWNKNPHFQKSLEHEDVKRRQKFMELLEQFQGPVLEDPEIVAASDYCTQSVIWSRNRAN